MRPHDTSEEAWNRQLDHWRGLDPEEKLAIVGRLNRSLLTLVEARLAAEYPEDSPQERRLRLASTWIPRDEMIKWWNWDPDERGR